MVRLHGRRPVEQPRLIEVELIDDDLPPQPATAWPVSVTIPPRWRRTVIAVVTAAALAAIGIGVWTHQDRLNAERIAALPYPLSTLSFHYDGTTAAKPAAGPPTAFQVDFTITAAISGDVEVTAINQDYRGVATTIEPALPFHVTPGKAVHVTMRWWVFNCTVVPHGSFLPGVNITGRNDKATQTWTVLFGSVYAADLVTRIDNACHPSSGVK